MVTLTLSGPTTTDEVLSVNNVDGEIIIDAYLANRGEDVEPMSDQEKFAAMRGYLKAHIIEQSSTRERKTFMKTAMAGFTPTDFT